MRFLLLFFVMLTATTHAQTDSLYFTDGQAMPGKRMMTAECAKAFDKDAKKKKSKFTYNGEAICGCFFEGMASSMTYDEFMKAIEDKNFISKASSDQSSPMFKMMVNCVLANMQAKESAPEASSKSKTQNAATAGNSAPESNLEELMVQSCIEAFNKKAGKQQTEVNAEQYCRCAMGRVIEQKISFDRMGELQNPNSELFQAIIVPCLQQSSTDKSTPAERVAGEVVGDNPSEEIPLTQLGKVYRVQARIGKHEKFFILDSGASDVIINSDFERDLIFDGLVSKSDYMTDKLYQLANGEQVNCRRFKLKSMQLGGYTLNNVVVAIMDRKDVTFLLGKSALDKFSNWSINNENSTLKLVK